MIRLIALLILTTPLMAAPPRLVIVTAEDEYRTAEALPPFAKKHLQDHFTVEFVLPDPNDKHKLLGIEKLKDADLVLFSVRRRPLVKDEIAIVKAYVAAGKPLVAIRTSSHAFAARKGDKLPAGIVEWPEFDAEILGGNYHNHYAQNVVTKITTAAGEAKAHPILKGVPSSFESKSGLYKTGPLAKDCVALLMGTSGTNPIEPLAWCREKTEKRGRVVYIALAHTTDFAGEAFPKLLTNACDWAIAKE